MTLAPDQVRPASRAIKRFSVDDYHRLGEVGLIAPDERTELIDGVVYAMSPPGARHSGHVDWLTSRFFSVLANRAHIRVQSPIRLDAASEPQPDLALLRVCADAYVDSLPEPNDVLLVVEVAENSLPFDFGPKPALYARHRIPELWVVDATAGRIVVHREPGPAGYGSIVAMGSGDALAPLAFPDQAWPVEKLLGPTRDRGA